jgi:hypothetical protein
MKIFNVSLRVQINQIGEIPDNPPDLPVKEKEPFDDDPVNKQEKILNKYLDRVERMNAPRPVMPGMFYGNESDGASMTRNIRISAETFEDLAEILKKFSDIAKTLPEVPDSVVPSASPFSIGTPMG